MIYFDCFSEPREVDAMTEKDLEIQEKKRQLDLLLQENAELREKQRWIPVTERLPDTMQDKSPNSGWSNEFAPTDDVLCLIGEENRMTVAWYSYTYNEWTTTDEKTVYSLGEITHWMPLPKEPEVGE